MELCIASNKNELGRQAATQGGRLIRQAITQRGRANIIVATGASQFEMLAELLKQGDVAWNKVTAFHLDEYVGMPITHPASFRKYLWERFVSKLPMPLAAFHYIDGENDSLAECRRVGEIIRRHPIDVAFVGIGENAHLAFNDPPADFETDQPYVVVKLDENCRRQQAGEGWFSSLADVPDQAISMSCRQIMKSRAIIVSVPDKRKAQPVRAVIEGGVTPQVPASILQRHENTTLYLDAESASLLRSKEVALAIG